MYVIEVVPSIAYTNINNFVMFAKKETNIFNLFSYFLFSNMETRHIKPFHYTKTLPTPTQKGGAPKNARKGWGGAGVTPHSLPTPCCVCACGGGVVCTT